MMCWSAIGAKLGLSRECVRKDALHAMAKIRRSAPWLADIFAAASLAKYRSPAQQMIDAAPADEPDEPDEPGDDCITQKVPRQ